MAQLPHLKVVEKGRCLDAVFAIRVAKLDTICETSHRRIGFQEKLSDTFLLFTSRIGRQGFRNFLITREPLNIP